MSDESPRLYRRNPFLRIRVGAAIECDLLLDGRTFELPSAALVGVIAGLTEAHTLAEFRRMTARSLDDPAHADAVVDAFVRAGILVDAERQWPQMPAVEHWIERGWLDALLFHLRAGSVDFADDDVPEPVQVQEAVLRRTLDEPPALWKEPAGPTTPLGEFLPRAALPPLHEVLLRRRSNRPWAGDRLSLTELSTVLRHCSAEARQLREQAEAGTGALNTLLNSAFSAFELYVAVFAVDGLAPGLYHYQLRDHTLTLMRGADLRTEFVGMCAGQPRAGGGSATIVITAVWERCLVRYQHPHAYRVLMVNAGELGQKILLLATALGLSTFLTPAFDERTADGVMGLDPTRETPIEAIGIG